MLSSSLNDTTAVESSSAAAASSSTADAASSAAPSASSLWSSVELLQNSHYRTAVSLNNTGIALLQRQCYLPAVQVFQSALEQMTCYIDSLPDKTQEINQTTKQEETKQNGKQQKQQMQHLQQLQ
jgi:hypothetical protein